MKLFATNLGLLALLLVGLLPALAPAQDQNRGNRVARISLIEGDVSYQRAGDKRTEWYDATLNTPLDENDQLYSGQQGRAEIQLSGRNLIRINRDTNLRITQFNTTTAQFALSIGAATFRVDSLDRRQFNTIDIRDAASDDPLYFEVDTPAVAITFLKEGNYRVNVRDDGTTEVIVRRGQAEIYNQELGTVPVKQGRRVLIEGRDPGYYQIARLEDKDNWDRWNDRRDDDLFARADDSRSRQYVPAGIAGVYDLDRYGEWINTPEYGWVWSPNGVAGGWAPYRSGSWRHYSNYGWTWISSEPWGWAPYHYGRWAYWRSRWCWTPFISIGVGGIGVNFWDWAPHQVAWFGWGGRYNRGYRDGFNDGYRTGYRDGRYDWVGWCPLGPGERWDGYGRGGRFNDGGPAPVRSIASLRNYGAPGGVSGMDGRRFDTSRVVADTFTAPPRGVRTIANNDRTGGNAGNQNNDGVLEFARPEVFRPTQNETARLNPVARESAAGRALEAPIIVRRAPPADRTMPGREGFAAPGAGRTPNERGMPSREGNNGEAPINAPPRRSNADSNSGFENIPKPERQSRVPDFRPVERPAPPTRNAGEGRSMPERESSGTIFSAPRERNMPNRDMPNRTEPPARDEAPAPRRVEPPSRPPERNERPERYEPPPRPPVERRDREMPSRQPERQDPPRRPERQDPPPRESAPAREVERPSAPQRQAPPPERPAMPTRESGPAREMPSRPERKPDSDQ